MKILNFEQQRERHAAQYGVTVNTPFLFNPGLMDKPLSETRLPTDIKTYYATLERACGRRSNG
jgi:hypothetical protein